MQTRIDPMHHNRITGACKLVDLHAFLKQQRIRSKSC